MPSPSARSRADQQQGDKAGDNHRQERSEDQVQRVRDHAAQPLLDHAHKPHRQQHREDGALVTDHRHFDAEEIHGVEVAATPQALVSAGWVRIPPRVAPR